MAKNGTVGILNVGAGDTKLSFDPSNQQEAIRAARIVKDMLRRGYALLVDSGKADAQARPIYVRAKDFDETKHEYIIADFDSTEEPADEEAQQKAAPILAKTGKKGYSRVAAATTNAIAVARSAGG